MAGLVDVVSGADGPVRNFVFVSHTMPDRAEEGVWQRRKRRRSAQSWRRHWAHVIAFFAFAPEVRKIIYTTNAIESLHSGVRKSIRDKGYFPSDEAASKLIWLALRNITAN